MDYQVVFRNTFVEDLEGIVRYIAAEDPPVAERIGELIICSAEGLSLFPERHPKVRQRPGIRRFVVKNRFKVFYRVLSDSRTVEVLRCWDGRREADPTFPSAT